MSRKRKTPRIEKHRPIEIDDGGVFARQFDEMMKAMFESADYDPKPAKVIDLRQWRKNKKS